MKKIRKLSHRHIHSISSFDKKNKMIDSFFELRCRESISESLECHEKSHSSFEEVRYIFIKESLIFDGNTRKKRHKKKVKKCYVSLLIIIHAETYRKSISSIYDFFWCCIDRKRDAIESEDIRRILCKRSDIVNNVCDRFPLEWYTDIR